MSLRVGILSYDFYPFIGGQGRVTHDLARRLAVRDDIEVAVISPARNSLAWHSTRFAFTQRYGRHPLFSLLASASARRWARGRRLDVLHVNGGPGGVLLLRDPGVPLVYSLYHTYEQVARLMPGHGWKSPAARVERSAYARAAMLVASTPSTAASLNTRLGLRALAHVIPCGTDFEMFPDRKEARDGHTVLFVGRLDNRKDPGLLVRAFASVAAFRPAARLVIVGTGPLEAVLRAQVAERGLEARVVFEQFVQHAALVDWYACAALVVVPSRFEGFGLSAVEAQACGACVVATDSEGLRDVIIDSETGVLAAAEPSALAAAIVELLGDPARRARLGAAASARVRSAYAWGPIVERWVDVYRAASAQRA